MAVWHRVLADHSLKADPKENQIQLQASEEEFVKIPERLATWIQHQHDMTAKLSESLQ
jgi:hypothetical protein